MLDFCWDAKSMVENIVDQSVEYLKVHASDRKTLILGVSGGADSALVAALAYKVCEKTGLRLIGVSMPIISNKPDEIARAEMIGNAFCNEFYTKDLTKSYRAALEDAGLGESDNSRIDVLRKANIKARVRMIHEYDRAQATTGFVLSTDNFTEYLLGFWTLHGDVGDFGMIQNLWKSEVYNVLEYLVRHVYNWSGVREHAAALKACINATPTDGLGVSKSDFEQLCPDHDTDAPAKDNYLAIDKVLYKYLIEGEIVDETIIGRHLRSQFKRENPFNIPRRYILHKPFRIREMDLVGTMGNL